MQDIYRQIFKDPRFHELQRKRSRLGWTLAAIVIANDAWYILATAFSPEAAFARFWGQPISEGAATTWGIVIGLAQTVLFILLVLYYIHRANGEFEVLKDVIVADALRVAGKQS